MTDETDNTPEAPAAETPAAPAAPTIDPKRLDSIEAKIGALTDTVRASLSQRAQHMQAGNEMTPGYVPAAFRQLLKADGLTDADIDANAPVVVPFLKALLATDGAVIASGVQQAKDEIEMVKASRNSKKFPHWNEVEDYIVEAREEAAKQGRYLAPADAYKVALARDVSSDESRVEAAKARRKAESSSSADDVSAQNLGANHGSRKTAAHVRRTAVTADDVAAMSREERRKFYDQIGDLKIT